MPDINKTLQDGSKALGEAAAQARGWVTRVARSASIVASEERSLLDETRRSENLARRLNASSNRRSSVGVFGPSQAGKSYLVSALGRSDEGPLIADFAGIPKSFIHEINPGGGKESTGLVTRFTVIKGSRDTVHPVEIRLLTETDLVKILGNSFLSDFSQHARKLQLQSEDAIRAGILALEGVAHSSSGHLDDIAMFDIGEYFTAHFRTTTTALTDAGYWDALTRLGPHLPLAQRVTLYSMLWGGNRDISEMFLLLQAALEKLEHASSARCAMDGVLPRERSLINVDLVKDALGTARDQKDLLSVVPERADGSDGPAVQVARATLCALTAELKIVMSKASSPFFENADLLDFPGARSREQMIELDPDSGKRADQVRNMVRRGKVSFLFQRYTEDRELASMLLCMPPKPPEVKDLSTLVRQWVGQTHGETPEERAQLPCALFFILTFFDEEMKAKTGDTPEELRKRIDARIESSMFGLYKHEDWFQDWARGQAFNNTYFVRNPEWPSHGIIEYDELAGQTREAGIHPIVRPLLEAVREGMMASPDARKHFRDPERAWAEAVALNDGGIPYLIGVLSQVLSPTLKFEQLAGRLRRQGELIDQRLRRFYQADDEQSRQKKDQALVDTRMALHRACAGRGFRNFFQFLSCMKVAESEIRSAYLNLRPARHVEDHDDSSSVRVADSLHSGGDPWAEDPWAAPPPAHVPAARANPVLRQRDRYADFASQVLNLWTDRLRGISANGPLLNALRIDGQVIDDVVNELVIAANRLQLGDRIAERVRTQVFAAGLRQEDVADRSAGIAATLINDFVAYLGFGDLPLDRRPGFPEVPRQRVVSVFQPPAMPRDEEVPTLGDQRYALERDYFRDWGVSLRQLGLDNVSYAGGRQIGDEDNRLLGQILGTLAPALHSGRA